MAEKIHELAILEINTSFGYAGAQRTMISFCKYFNPRYFRVYAVSYGEGGPREKDLQKMGVEYLIANYDISKIVSFAKEKKIEIIHIHRSGRYNEFEYSLMKALHDTLPKSVFIETNVFGEFDKMSDRLIDCHLMKSKMMLNERFVKESEYFDFKRMKVIYNPVDSTLFEKFVLSPEEIIAYKKELGIKDTDFVIGRLGRPDIAKWGDLVLDMLPTLIKLVPNVKCILQAVPQSRSKKIKNSFLKKYCVLLPETSNESEVHRFYQTIDVLAHSSKIGEAFGNTLNEAMYWKKPVVVNSTPHRDNGQLEQIEHMTTGIIANFPETFARAIAYLATHTDEMRRMGENGRRKVTTEYNPQITTRRLEKVFIEKMLEKKEVEELNSEVIQFYSDISNFPSEADIVAYREEYKKLTKCEFGRVTEAEKIRNLFRRPIYWYRKMADFIEHRFS